MLGILWPALESAQGHDRLYIRNSETARANAVECPIHIVMETIATEIMMLADSGGVTDCARTQMAAAFHQHAISQQEPEPVKSTPIVAPCDMCAEWALSVASRSHALVDAMETQHRESSARPDPSRAQEIAGARAIAAGASDFVKVLESGQPLHSSRKAPTVQAVLQNLLNLASIQEARHACVECEELLPLRAALSVVDDIVRIHGTKDTDK